MGWWFAYEIQYSYTDHFISAKSINSLHAKGGNTCVRGILQDSQWCSLLHFAIRQNSDQNRRESKCDWCKVNLI
jgi:hypothetical protein